MIAVTKPFNGWAASAQKILMDESIEVTQRGRKMAADFAVPIPAKIAITAFAA